MKTKFITLLLLLFIYITPILTTANEFEDEEGEEDIGIPVGIDLGTTNSVVSVFRNGKVEVIANEQGKRITPSVVAFKDNVQLVGDAAKNQATKNPKNTIFSIKRLIGRMFNEKSVKNDIKKFPYTIVNKQNKPAVSVVHKSKKKEFRPEEISAIILSKMKAIAEAYLDQPVTHAVITVPAHFNDAQRRATKDAGIIAGLKVMRLVNEPTAAAIANGANKDEKEKNILIFDLGGGTFDVSVLTVDKKIFEVLSTNGDTNLGGDDFDHNIVKYLARDFKKEHGVDLLKDQRALSILKEESENAKISLSSAVTTKIEVERIYKDKSLSITLTRAKFEELNSEFFKKTIKIVKKAISDAHLKPSKIDSVILAGGSTKMPKIPKMLGEFFGEKKISTEVNPDEAVAIGAAIQAAILSGKEEDSTKDMVLLDVTPMSLGIETVGGVHSKIIKKNEAIPTSMSQVFTTNEDHQKSVTISIYEGESNMVKYNHLLGRFDLTGIQDNMRGVPQIEVSFDIDADGILLVRAKDKDTGKENNVTIDEAMSGSSSEELEKMKKNFEAHKEEDEKLYNATMAKNSLNNAVYEAQKFKKDNADKLSKDDVDDLDNLIKETSKWNESADPSETEPAEYEEKIKEVQDILKELKPSASGDGEDSSSKDDEDEEEGDDEEEENEDDEDGNKEEL